jgi:hypothetical protein
MRISLFASLTSYTRKARTGQPERYMQNKTGRTGQAEKDPRAEKGEQDWQKRTETTSREGCEDRAAWIRAA